ncbi:hypothetical protein [Nocardioides bruguierae]|uniref:hypothetical protein n=1 Tax=Nocardioides bruguierae TaxID=2945102 RepID=UPI0020204473|nr:hypothetical protein [Nocardioides bruguierae]MCL8024548.1 hypothetical protein [Nocardioides bruguierae]
MTLEPPTTSSAAPAVRGLVDDATASAGLLGGIIATRAVPDTELPGVADAAPGPGADAMPPVLVVLTAGAGQVAGPARLVDKRGIVTAGLQVALRDEADPVGNARRVAAAVDAARGEGLLLDADGEDVPVWVTLPPTEATHGWLAAADELAMSDLRAALPTDAGLPASVLPGWIDACLDRELRFRCTGGLPAALPAEGRPGWLSVLAGTAVAWDGGAGDEVAEALTSTDADTLRGVDLERARRWFVSFTSTAPAVVAQDAATLGLLG